MAPLLPSSTARLYVDYVTGSTTPVAHTLMVRYTGTDRTAAAAQARVASLLTGIGAAQFRVGWRVTSVRTSLAGENFTSAQVTVSALASFLGSNTFQYARRLEAREWVFCGRALNGARRVRLSLYGIGGNIADPETFRYVPGSGNAPAWVASGLSALNAASSPLVTIDGSPIVWYNYLNTNYNSYWERRLRAS